ncbi:MAG: hypothetical protein FJ102_03955 [Deltaproteobacteria bacterium]|nr:hypothetical protein [Deltaproteobacteria bacterium]
MGWPGREEEPIARHLPLRSCPGAFERWAVVDSEEELVAAIRAARAEKLPVRVVHPFADSLPPEGGMGGLFLRLGRDFEDIREAAEGIDVGASCPVARVGLRPGFELLARAGGTVGDALDEGWLRPWTIGARRFKGRGFEDTSELEADPKALVVRVRLRPAGKLAPVRAGTIFREPGKRGLDLRALLARSGVSGVRLHGASLAEDDAAVLVNRGEASPRQVRLLVEAVRERVHVATGVELDLRLLPPGRGGRM